MERNDILGFSDEYYWLSNFHPFDAPLNLGGLEYKTVEHFYVAMKTQDKEIRAEITDIINPGKVKRFGRKIKIREDWDEIKYSVMTVAIGYKFSVANKKLRAKLIATHLKNIVEVNNWNDVYWGVCDNVGLNNLGKIIMIERAKILGA